MRFKYVSCGECDGCVLGGGGAACYNRIMVEVKPKKPAKKVNAAEQRERAMEAGMGLGIEAYNDAMGY